MYYISEFAFEMLLDKGYFRVLVDLLSFSNTVPVLLMTMEMISRMFCYVDQIKEEGQKNFLVGDFNDCKGFDKIIELQHHSHHQIYEKAAEFYSQYYIEKDK